jgi:uncharacterized protein
VGRILFFVILGLVIWLIVRGILRAQDRASRAPGAKSAQGEDMVTCAKCGVNLPRSEAREENGRLVCNDNPRCRAGP